ncbi:MAG: ATP-binding protein [Patescibacteria group bacterium]
MINKNIIKEVVLEQNFLFRKKGVYLKRGLAENSLKTKKIFIITGIRRSGKSTLLKQISQNYQDFYYLNFEDERLLNFKSSDFNYLLEVFIELYGGQKVFLFDEIQYIKGWEKFVGRLFANGYKIFITGSSANLLSRELGTALTGRHLKMELYPFSFKEYLAYFNLSKFNLNLTEDRAKLKKYFKDYLEYGGFPEILESKDKNELSQLYQDVLVKDLLVRFKIKDDKAFRELVLYLMSNIGTPVSFNNLKKILGFKSVSQVKNYVAYLEEAYLVFLLYKYDFSLGKQMINDRKVYGIDAGMIKAVSFRFSENSGRYLENLVFLELKRKEKEIYYHKSDYECDFIVRKGLKIAEAIQVTENLNINNNEREINGLVSALKKYNLKEGLILTSDLEEDRKLGDFKIKIRPIWKWLLAHD